MGKLIIPNPGDQPPTVRNIDEIAVYDSTGNELSRKPVRGTVMLVELNGKRVLAARFAAIRRSEFTPEAAVFFILFGVWIVEIIRLMRS